MTTDQNKRRQKKMASGVKITNEEMQMMNIFETTTGAHTKDCIIDQKLNRIIFIVKEGDMGLALGRQGSNLKRVKELLKKNIDVVEYTEIPEELVKKALAPARIKTVSMTQRKDGRKVAIVTVDAKDRGVAIGKGGRNVEKARIIARRYLDIQDVIIT
jgi:N utilization substance protein A